MIRQPILTVFAALALGVGGGDLLGVGGMAAGLAVLCCLPAVLVATLRRRGAAIAGLFCLVAVGAWAAASQPVPPPLFPSCGEQGGRWRATVDAPVARAINFETGRMLQRTILTDLAERCAGGWFPRRGRVSVGLFGDKTVARGDRVDLRLRLESVLARRNSVGPDPLLRARQDRLRARGVAETAHAVVVFGRGPLAVLDGLRTRAAERFERVYPPEIAALAKALTLGDRASITPETREHWAIAGVAHLLAISGLHVGFVAWLAFALVLAIVVRVPRVSERTSARRLAAGVTIPLVILFCLWTGASLSAIRATVMAVAYLLGLALGRPNSAKNALGVAGVGILLFSPTSLYAAGFLLSFAAVAALLLIPTLRRRRSWAQKLGRFVAGMVIASLVATLATAPVSAFYFGRVSLVAPLTNLVAVPWGTLVAVPLALVFTLVAPLSPTVEWFFGQLLAWALSGLDGIARLGAAVPLGSLDLPKPSLLEVAAYAALLLCLFLRLRSRRLRLTAAVALMIFLGSVMARVYARGGDGALHIYHPYVRQGDAALIELPEGGVMLFDAGGTFEPGGWDPGRQVLAPLLRSRGIRYLDVAVVSHPDPDHLNGFLYLSQAFPIGELWWNGSGEDLPVMRSVVANVKKSGGLVRLVADLPAVQVREGVTVSLWHPRPRRRQAEGLPYFPELSDNDNSVVMHLRYGERSTILLGDIEAESEALLAASLPRADIFKSPHHGSRSSSTPGLLAALNARAVVISCGFNNRFGFPKPESLDRYAQNGLAVFRTDTDGAIETRTAGQRWTIETQLGRRATLDRQGPALR